MPWALRGLRNGVVTTGWPRHPDGYTDRWQGLAEPIPDPGVRAGADVEAVCPTGAITITDGVAALDWGACIGCGRCIRGHPDLFRWHAGADTPRLRRGDLVVVSDADGDDEEELRQLRAALAERTRLFGRSVHIRHVDAGSDGTEEWEIAALLNPTYDIHRLGLFFTASPRHADVLLVTGIGATGMTGPLRRTRQAMPEPVVTVAVGTDACSGGLLTESYAGTGGLAAQLPVDVWVPGSPPPPFTILQGLLLALGRLPERATTEGQR